MKILPWNLWTKQSRNFPISVNYLQQGQALILLLLVLSVVLVVSLSIASRSITDIGTATYEEEAHRAFSAAEAGIEEVLNNPSLGGFVNPNLGNNTGVNAIVPPAAASTSYIYPKDLSSGESAPFWLTSRDSATGAFTCSGTNPCFRGPHVTVCWGTPGSPQPPAVLVSLYYDAGTGAETGWATTQNNYKNVRVARFAYDSRSPARIGSTSGAGNIDGQQFRSCQPINIVGAVGSCAPSGQNCVLMLHAKMLFNDDSNPQPVGVKITTGGPGNIFPDQGLRVGSTGTAGETQRRVEVLRTHPLAPSMFESAIFSMTDIIK